MARTVGELSAAGAVDVVPCLTDERAEFVDLLASLEDADWDRPTECPAWSVKGLALHVLGDDLSLLARQRDGMIPSVLTEPALPAWDGAPDGPLDRFNERWVLAATFLSPILIVELLRLTGEWTHAWYAAVDPNTTGEVVLLVGPDPAPYWVIAAREYLERWVHHLQIRRALHLDAGPLGGRPYAPMAAAVVARILPQLFTRRSGLGDVTVAFRIGDDSWTVARRDGDTWELLDGDADDCAVNLRVDAAAAPALLSRGLSRLEAEQALVIRGDSDLGSSVRLHLADVLGR
jgi:uncharacterized protein (TIGR03083 family)